MLLCHHGQVRKLTLLLAGLTVLLLGAAACGDAAEDSTGGDQPGGTDASPAPRATDTPLGATPASTSTTAPDGDAVASDELTTIYFVHADW